MRNENNLATASFFSSSVSGFISSVDSEKFVCLVRAACAWASSSLFKILPQLENKKTNYVKEFMLEFGYKAHSSHLSDLGCN